MHLPKRLRRRATLYEPGSSPLWPDAGHSTADEAVAKSWLTTYASWINNELALDAVNGREQEGPLFIPRAAKEYIESIRELWGSDYSTVVNRSSNVKVHIIPRFPQTMLPALTTPMVQGFLDDLVVSDGNGGMKRAELNTKQAIRDTLAAIWRHHMKSDPLFAGVRLDNTHKRIARRKAILDGHYDKVEGKESYLPDEINRLLVRAMVIDLQRANNIAKSNTPYTALAIALSYGLATRVSELRLLRWKCLDRHERLLLIPGAKNENAFRWMLLFESVWPWIVEAERMAGAATGDMDWLIRVDPRADHESRQLATTTVQNRVNDVYEADDLKIPGKATHVLRASWITNVMAEGMATRTAKILAGHSAVGGATERYLKRLQLMKMIKPADRRRLTTLLSPDEVRQRAWAAISAATEIPVG
jgi:integrase